MANKKITDLPAGTRMRADDLIEVVQTATSKQISLEEIAPGPDMPPAVAATEDDEFDAGSLDAKWTWTNQGSATITFSKSRGILKAVAVGADDAKILTQPAPTRPYTITAKILCEQFIRTQFMIGGLCLRESSSGKLFSMGVQFVAADGEKIVAKPWASSTNSSGGGDVGLTTARAQRREMFYSITDDNTNLIFKFSYDGVLYHTIATVGRLAHMATGPNQVGFMCAAEQATYDSYVIIDWFRKT